MNTINVNEVEYVMHTDFRIGIKFEMMMLDPTLSYMDKIIKALSLYYPIAPKDVSEAIEQLLWFYRCDIASPITENKKRSGSNRS